METSDSEYFESADEDFDSSDHEERTKSEQSVVQNTSQKTVEPEVCKLKNDERSENIIQEPKEVTTNIGSVDSEKSQSGNEDRSLNLVSKKCDNSEIIRNVVDKKKSEVQPEKNIELKQSENDNEKMERPKTTTKTEEDLSPVSNSTEMINTDNNNPQIDRIEIEPKQKADPEPETEENLWNDDEIDWGSEAAIEESQKTEDQTLHSKHEDSGWDDFDADWETENPISPVKTSGSYNEPIGPKAISSVAGDTRKSGGTRSNVEEHLWEDDDDWEPLEKPEDKPNRTEEQSGWGSWGTWDVSSLLNTATQGVSSLTSHVSQGLSTVLESGIGIPEPEELAKMHKLDKEGDATEQFKLENSNQVSDNASGFRLDNLVSGMSQFTKFVESTGTKVITGGLDTLEAIGKKTVEVLQEGDPGFKKKKAFLKLDAGKPNLSQMLREAKEKAEEENQNQHQYTDIKRAKNYEALFDDHQGLVHLEALEMLSRLCSIKLSNLNSSLTGDALKDMQETLEQVKELCAVLPEDEEEEVSLEAGREIVKNALKELNIPISYDKLFSTLEESDTWLNNLGLDFIGDTELHQQAIETLAQLTALAVEQFHKAGELLMVKEYRSTADEAVNLEQITTALKSLILVQAGKFSDKLNLLKNTNKDNINEHITNIFYEAANSVRYIQDAFELLIPVLQVGAV